jgi:hypothetical protein
MSLRDMDALKGIPTCSLPKPLFHVGAGFSPHVGAEARTHMRYALGNHHVGMLFRDCLNYPSGIGVELGWICFKR